jgi:hypothetical protein
MKVFFIIASLLVMFTVLAEYKLSAMDEHFKKHNINVNK